MVGEIFSPNWGEEKGRFFARARSVADGLSVQDRAPYSRGHRGSAGADRPIGFLRAR